MYQVHVISQASNIISELFWGHPGVEFFAPDKAVAGYFNEEELFFYDQGNIGSLIKERFRVQDDPKMLADYRKGLEDGRYLSIKDGWIPHLEFDEFLELAKAFEKKHDQDDKKTLQAKAVNIFKQLKE